MSKTMSKGWTQERRRAAAQRIRKNKPWEKSTGPKTKKGKKQSSMNAYKHGGRSYMAGLIKRIFRGNRECFTAFIELQLQDPKIFARANELIKMLNESERYRDSKKQEKSN